MTERKKIYTRKGDDGTTALGSGERVSKSSPRMAAYGTVDETNAAIGLARLLLSQEHVAVSEMLGRIQNDLFDLGADLSLLDGGRSATDGVLRLQMKQVERLEHEIDRMEQDMPPVASFILPGGSRAGAALHLARTICRRAERCIVTLKRVDGEPVSEAIMAYINRLSDHLLVAARFVNEKGAKDLLWTSTAQS